ncbi:polymorphic outer membrane protein middle domain-containing protein [Candidatus Chlamydia corallus]|uniref:polymorphic outer membrane protein middle domain-containing protein n=1 Tax=Candidatus Chlamydia corallus TaxID=2038470 RepID=UPI000C2F9915|nr:polymorphic outer membrane protein middle domain-containing protein [Candidatus Chlamydia corallus]
MKDNRFSIKVTFLSGILILGTTITTFGITPLSDYLGSQVEEIKICFPLLEDLTNFSPNSLITTLLGNTKDITQDFTFNNYTSIESYPNTKGALSCKSLSITNTKARILFLNRFSINNGGAVFTAGSFNLSDNHGLIIFLRNQSLSNDNNRVTDTQGGAIFCSSKCTISRNQGTQYFVNNMAKKSGGAIVASQITINDNTGPMIFCNNTAAYATTYTIPDTTINVTPITVGGAIFADTTFIENNSKPIYFLSNQSGLGGAIRTTGSCSIKKNQGPIVFNNNVALDRQTSPDRCSGGAIFCSEFLIENNPGTVSFDNNVCARNGGAIYTQFMTIKNSGPVYFTNNQGTWGGAVCIHQAGNCTLFAEQGDIIFHNNRTFSTNDSKRRHNAINCANDTTVSFGANQDRSIIFYDPILQKHNVSSIQTVNPEPNHLGTILFSSAYVSNTSISREDFISIFKNNIGLYHGTLALEDRAEWKVYKFDQFGGTLRLGSGAIFSTTSKENNSIGSEININNLAINLPSVLKKESAPMLWVRPISTVAPYSEDNNPVINLSGPLTLLTEENLDPYDSTDLSQPLKEVPLLYLLDVTDRHINTDNFHPESLNTVQHYGYQGIWSPYWIETVTISDNSSEQTTNTVHRQLYADWTPIGYKVNPENKGDIALTTLWQSFHSLFAILRNQNYQSEVSSTASGEAIGLFVHQNSNSNAIGFRMDATGYSLEAASNTSNHRFAVNFTQFFSNIKESGSRNKVASHTTALALQLDTPWMHEKFSTSSCLAYSYSNHHLRAFRNYGKIETEGKCYGTTLGAAFSCSLPLQWRSQPLHFIPFMQAIAVRSNQTAFEETGDKPRKFATNKPLYNLTVPLGIQSSWQSKFHLPTHWNLELAYQPVLYQQNPEVNVSLASSGSTWPISEMTLARSGISFKCKNHTFIFPNFSVFLDYQGSVSSSTSTHYLQAGTTIKF